MCVIGTTAVSDHKTGVFIPFCKYGVPLVNDGLDVFRFVIGWHNYIKDKGNPLYSPVLLEVEMEAFECCCCVLDYSEPSRPCKTSCALGKSAFFTKI